MATHLLSGSFNISAELTTLSSKFRRRRPLGQVVRFTITASLEFDPEYLWFTRALSHNVAGLRLDLSINEDPQYTLITRSQVWWNKSYIYRRILQVQPNLEGFGIGHPLKIILGKDTVKQGKINRDGSDIEILRLVMPVPEVWEVVPKHIESHDTEFVITWPNQIEIQPNQIVKDTYYAYYGNRDLINAPVGTEEYEPTEWPVHVSFDNPKVTYTRPGEHWRDGLGLEDGARATLEFYGSKARLISDIGPHWGIAEVQIDDRDWERIDLYHPLEEIGVEVFRAENLPIGYHTIRVRRSGAKAASASEYNININAIEYMRHNSVANISEEADEALMWGSAIGGSVGK